LDAMAEKPAVFNQLNLVVADIDASRDFYSRLGIEVPRPEQEGVPYHAGCELANGMDFDLDTPRFAPIWNKGWAGRDDLVGRIVLGFHLPTREGVDATFAELTGAGYKDLQPPFDAFWGARYAIVEDPNGIAVGLMSPVDPSRRFWPPEGWKD
jgi:catechol 2,3-dioxygenase-like lactoylglutathione lyase family enzyme